MNDAKLEKAKMIIARLLVSQIFSDWESRSRSDVIAVMMKMSDEMELGINASAIFERMVGSGLIHQTGSYNDQPYYSTKKRDELIHI